MNKKRLSIILVLLILIPFGVLCQQAYKCWSFENEFLTAHQAGTIKNVDLAPEVKSFLSSHGEVIWLGVLSGNEKNIIQVLVKPKEMWGEYKLYCGYGPNKENYQLVNEFKP